MQNHIVKTNPYLIHSYFQNKILFFKNHQIKLQHMSKFIGMFVTIALIFKQIQSLSFHIQIEESSEICFSHLIAQSTLYHFSVEAGSHPNFKLSLKFADGTILMMIEDIRSMKKIDSYATVTEHYSFCIQNSGPIQQFLINYYSGLELSDISLLPKQEDHHLIEKLVNQLNLIYQTVRSQELYMKTANQYNMELQKLVSFKYVGFGFLSITVVLIISFLHYLQIKRVLKTRKII